MSKEQHELEKLTDSKTAPKEADLNSPRSETYRAAVSLKDDEKQALTSKEPKQGELASKKVDDSELKGKYTLTLAAAVAVCSIGSSLQFGYNIGVCNTPEKVVRAWIRDSHYTHFNDTLEKFEDDLIWSITVSIFSIGGMTGGLMCGWLADKWGRKGAMMFNNLIALAAAILMSMSKYADLYHLLILGRLVVGLNCGLNSGLSPMYLTEISPINFRGMNGSIHQLAVTIGILISQVIGLRLVFGTETLWPLCFAFVAVPALFQLICLPFCPESPKYNLIVKNRVEQAEKDLMRLRKALDVHAEIEQMKIESTTTRAVKVVAWGQMFKYPLLWPLIVCCMLMVSQQLSGINAIMFYSTNIFQGANMTAQDAQYATMGVGGLNVLMTVVSVLLVDSFGRRVLQLTGLAGMAITTALMTLFMKLQVRKNDHECGEKSSQINVACIIMVLLFVMSFATGPGSIPWFYVSELFRQNARGHANSLAVMTNWIFTFVVGIFFLLLKDILSYYVFLLFTAFNAAFFIFTFVYAPETRGYTIDHIVQRFEQREYLALRN